MKPIAIGECDACPKTEVDLFEVVGSRMRLCTVCYQAELAAIESSKVINTVVQQSLKNDSNIQLKADIFNAATVDFITLKASIDADETIPSDKKAETLVKLAEQRIHKFTEAIFNLNQEKINRENEREGWRKQTMEYISTLRAEQREKYSKFNISYAPVVATKKTIKSATTTRTRKPAFDTAACKAAAAKYNVPMASVQMLATSQNLSIEDAAKKMAALMNPTA